MVAHLGLRNHELLYEEICNIIAEIFHQQEKAECYEGVANHSKRINEISKNYDVEKIKETLRMVGYLD